MLILPKVFADPFFFFFFPVKIPACEENAVGRSQGVWVHGKIAQTMHKGENDAHLGNIYKKWFHTGLLHKNIPTKYYTSWRDSCQGSENTAMHKTYEWK